jgi:hypothetical protein
MLPSQTKGLLNVFEPPDRIEQYLRINFPEHVNGYKQGWLKVERVDLEKDGQNFFVSECFHLYTREDKYSEWKLFGTVI